MYGTVMIGRLAPGATLDDYDLVSKEWLERRVDGFVDEMVMRADDGRVVTVVRFRDQASYQALADSGEQDEFYQAKVMPLLDGEPEWVDGEWVATYVG